jgi:plastocyanin
LQFSKKAGLRRFACCFAPACGSEEPTHEPSAAHEWGTRQNAKGGGHTGAMTAGMVGTAIVFFPAAPLLLFVHGKDITIPKGTEVTAFVAGDMKLNMAKMAAPGSAPGSAGVMAGSAETATMASLSVDASVAGADIEVDGNFVGNTPSTVSVTPGQHTIAVKKKGYAEWSRTMNVSGSAVHLSAEMKAKP